MPVNARLRIAANSVSPQIDIASDHILDLQSHFSSSIDGSEVIIDTSDPIILADASNNPALFKPKNADSLTTSDGKILYVGGTEFVLQDIPYGTEVHYFESNTLMALWFLESVTRVATNNFQLSLISAFGLLDNVTHVGGTYSGITLQNLLSEIIQSTFSYTVDSEIRNWRVWGWLPYDTARENLHQVLLAMGVNIFKNANGTPRFGVLDTTSPISIPDAQIYTDGKVAYGAPATSIAVTEHQWVKRAVETETVFDNLDGSPAADHTTVIFDEPHYDLAPSSGLTVNSSGVNYAVVTGMGTLTGKKYSHIQRVVNKTSGAANVKPKEIKVTDAYLVNTMNSLNTADRLLNYYSSARTLTGKMIVDTARPGSPVTLKNAFGEDETAIISKMDVISSAVVAANFEAATDYVPPASGNNYTNRVQKTGNSSWSKPAGITKIRIVLIGGGQGGQSGGNGQNSLDGSAGGIGGQPGHGGNVYVADITVPSAATTINVTCGTGGAGGTAPWEGQEGNLNPGQYQYRGVSGADPVDGANGTDTTIAFTSGGTVTYSSANGQPIDDGFVDIVSGVIFGAKGDSAGTAGGKGGSSGGDAQGVTYGGTTYTGGTNGGSIDTASGGKGGGAAVGADGGDGGNADIYLGHSYGGYGGRGADASAQPTASNYGQGGSGGHGSGGGGAGGSSNEGIFYAGTSGKAGVGGTGGKGADGIVIFYY